MKSGSAPAQRSLRAESPSRSGRLFGAHRARRTDEDARGGLGHAWPEALRDHWSRGELPSEVARAARARSASPAALLPESLPHRRHGESGEERSQADRRVGR